MDTKHYIESTLRVLENGSSPQTGGKLLAVALMVGILMDRYRWPGKAAQAAVLLALDHKLALDPTNSVTLDWDKLVPPAGIEPALPKEPHFECGASTSSAKGATEGQYTTPVGKVKYPVAAKGLHLLPSKHSTVLRQITLPFGWTLEGGRILDSSRITMNGFDKFTYQVRITCGPTVDNMTGENLDGWSGRWWRLSTHMTNGEIVQTVFKAVMTALEHEAREMFLYKGVPVLDPHYDIDKLVEFRKDPSSILGRPNSAVEV